MYGFMSSQNSLKHLIENSPPKTRKEDSGCAPENFNSLDYFIKAETINSDEEFETHKIRNIILSSKRIDTSPLKKSPLKPTLAGHQIKVQSSLPRNEEIADDFEGSLVINNQIEGITKDSHLLEQSRMKRASPDNDSDSEQAFRESVSLLSTHKNEKNVFTFQKQRQHLAKLKPASPSPAKKPIPKRTPDKSTSAKAKSGEKTPAIRVLKTTRGFEKREASISQDRSFKTSRASVKSKSKSKNLSLVSESIRTLSLVKNDSFIKIDSYFDQKYNKKLKTVYGGQSRLESADALLLKSAANDEFVRFKKEKLLKIKNLIL